MFHPIVMGNCNDSHWVFHLPMWFLKQFKTYRLRFNQIEYHDLKQPMCCSRSDLSHFTHKLLHTTSPIDMYFIDYFLSSMFIFPMSSFGRLFFVSKQTSKRNWQVFISPQINLVHARTKKKIVSAFSKQYLLKQNKLCFALVIFNCAFSGRIFFMTNYLEMFKLNLQVYFWKFLLQLYKEDLLATIECLKQHDTNLTRGQNEYSFTYSFNIQNRIVLKTY